MGFWFLLIGIFVFFGFLISSPPERAGVCFQIGYNKFIKVPHLATRKNCKNATQVAQVMGAVLSWIPRRWKWQHFVPRALGEWFAHFGFG
jgi:hypothetical protein